MTAAETLQRGPFLFGNEAHGARYVKPGFTFSPEHDLKFALGWPYFSGIVDDHPDNAKAEELLSTQFVAYEHFWPRDVATRLCRLEAAAAYSRRPDGSVFLKEPGKELVRNSDPIEEEEARALIGHVFGEQKYRYRLGMFIRLLEALVGPLVVTEAITSAAEKYEGNFEYDNDPYSGVFYNLGFLLLRVPASAIDSLRARLSTVLERWLAAIPEDFPLTEGPVESSVRELDISLNGRAGMERSEKRFEGGSIGTHHLVHVLEDSDYVFDVLTNRKDMTDVNAPDVRLAFLGGARVIRYYTENLRWFKKHAAAMASPFSEVRSVETVRLMQELAKLSASKKAASDWLLEHADFVNSC